MILKVESGTFIAHFTHIPKKHISKLLGKTNEDASRWSHITICSIHAAPCATKERPCKTSSAVQAAALCSVLDNFCKYKGRKVSFGRAISAWPRALRTQLWNEFLVQNGVLPSSNETRQGGGTVGPDTPVPTSTGTTKQQEGRSHLPCT